MWTKQDAAKMYREEAGFWAAKALGSIEPGGSYRLTRSYVRNARGAHRDAVKALQAWKEYHDAY